MCSYIIKDEVIYMYVHMQSRRNRVARATSERWPGNELPKFKNDKKLLKSLDDFVDELLPDCEAPNFGKVAIRQHILDTLNERRRQVRKGYDYENVSY